MRRPLVIAIIALVAAIPILVYALNFTNNRSQQGNLHGQVAYVYDLAFLRANSTIIIVGDVIRVNTTYGLPSQPIHTLFEVNVIRYVKGNGPDTVLVSDLGGTLRGVTEAWEGAPLISVRSRYLLFLSNSWEDCAPPPPPCNLPPTPLETTYSLFAGAQGKFLVVNDLVFGFKTLYPKENNYFKVDANAEPIDVFLSRVLSD